MALLPTLVDSLCGYCALGDSGNCPVYPLQTRYCVEFKSYPSTAHDAAVIVAGGLRAIRDDPHESQKRFRFMCEIIQGER